MARDKGCAVLDAVKLISALPEPSFMKAARAKRC